MFLLATSVASECNTGRRPPKSIACEDAHALEQTRVGWLPPEPEPSPGIDKTLSTGLSEGTWCLYGAAVVPSNQNILNTESHSNKRDNPSGMPVFLLPFLPLNSDSVQNPSLASVMRVVHGAANFHPHFTSQQCTLTNENSTRVHDNIPLATLSMNIPACAAEPCG